MAKKTSKHLTPADLEIWQHVSKTVRPYDPSRPLPATEPAPKSVKHFAPKSAVYTPPQIRSKAKTSPPEIMADKRTRRGKIEIDRRIDLHDMTQDVARGALLSAIISARHRRQRCILVITGKGGLTYKGVLRRMFPLWLAQPEFRPHIASYAQSHQRHGGNGAWYVFLKRPEK